MMYYLFLETGPKVTVPLNDASVLEKSHAEFSCEISKPVDKVRWFLDDVELREGDTIEFVREGTKHKLIMKDVGVTDEGQITALIGDQKLSANLFVQGMIHICS